MSRTQVTDEMIHAAQSGDSDAMWDIVCAYEGVIRHAVRSVAPSANEEQAEDLLQEARAVLLEHIRDYNTAASSATLATYAHQAIRRAIAAQWVCTSTALTVESSAALRVRRALWDTQGDLEGAWMIVGSDEDPRRRMSRELFIATVEALADTESLEAAISHGEGATTTLAEILPDTTADFTRPTEQIDLARYLLRQIPPRQSYALRAFYGIAMTPTPDNEVAADMGVKLAALRKLRSNGLKSARTVATSHDLAA
jgi:RNA polymerase primary sigma factor